MLAWEHKKLMKPLFLENTKYDYFLYLEDDMAFTFENFLYFINCYPSLQPFGVIPSFLRVEYSALKRCWVNTDCKRPGLAAQHRKITLGSATYVNPPYPYCALYLMDRDMVKEYLASESFDFAGSKQRSNWRTRARSAMGLCYERIPAGFTSRYVVPVDEQLHPEVDCYVRHLPNNYALNNSSEFARIDVGEIFIAHHGS